MTVKKHNKGNFFIKNGIGAVTFLDVLGWKGIWEKEEQNNDNNAITKLQDLIDGLIKEARNIENEEISRDSTLRGKNIVTEVLSISDTIALFTTGNEQFAVNVQAKLSLYALVYGLNIGLPLRGAISYGNYSYAENIMMGYAVDEAANWHESTDWIGVVITPYAKMLLRNNKQDSIYCYPNIPFKGKVNALDWCVDWSFNDENALDELIKTKGPYTSDVAAKYLNTLAFFDYKKKHQETMGEANDT